MTNQEFRYLLSSYLRKTQTELFIAVEEDNRTPALEKAIASILLRSIKSGDFQGLNGLLDRLIGKVTDKIEHSAPKPTVIEFSDGRKLLLGSGEKDEQ